MADNAITAQRYMGGEAVMTKKYICRNLTANRHCAVHLAGRDQPFSVFLMLTNVAKKIDNFAKILSSERCKNAQMLNSLKIAAEIFSS